MKSIKGKADTYASGNGVGWIDVQHGMPQYNTPLEGTCRINTRCNQNIEIDKLYGPLASTAVRIRLEYKEGVSDWVVEVQNVSTNEWKEKARWDCQEDWPEPDDHAPKEEEQE